MIRVLIIDDHPATAMGLATLLEREPDIEVVGVAGDVKRTLAIVGDLAPSVLLCDIQLHGEPDGFEILRRLPGQGGPAVLLFTSFDYPAFRHRALELGAAGYLLKTAAVRDIVGAIRHVASGGTAFVASALLASHAPRPASDRELEVIQLVRSGLSNDEVATRLGISTRGVESSLRRLFQRYGVVSRTELVTFAERQGWLALMRKLNDRS